MGPSQEVAVQGRNGALCPVVNGWEMGEGIGVVPFPSLLTREDLVRVRSRGGP